MSGSHGPFDTNAGVEGVPGVDGFIGGGGGTAAIATLSVAGVVKPGTGLSVSSDGTLNAMLASTMLAGAVKPSGQGVEIANDGTLSAKQACRAAGWFNTLVEGYTKNDGVTDDTAGINNAWIASKPLGLKLFIPPAWTTGSNPQPTFTKITGTIQIGGLATAGDGRVEIHGIPGQTNIVSTSTTAHLLHVGNGNQLPNGASHTYIRGLRLNGPGRPALGAANSRNGQTGILLDAVFNTTVEKCEVGNCDIGADAINNCAFMTWRDCAIGPGLTVNVGVNLRGYPNQGAGNQMAFYACQVSGYLAGYHISSTVDGLTVHGGQMGCGNGGGTPAAPNDIAACVVFGLDYLTGASGGCGQLVFDCVDCEQFQGRLVRGFGQAIVIMRGCPIISVSSGFNDTSNILPTGIIKVTGFGNGTFLLSGGFARGNFGDASAMLLQGYGGSTIREEGVQTDNLYMGCTAALPGGVQVQTQSLLAQSGQVPGIAIYHEYGQAGRRAGDTIYMGGSYLQAPGGSWQSSADCINWNLFATVAPAHSYYLANLPPVGGGAQPFASFDASFLRASNSQSIRLLKDFSGFGNDLVPLAGSSAPVFVASGINGLPAIQFNASGSSANGSSALVLARALVLPPEILVAAGGADFTFIMSFAPASPVPSSTFGGPAMWFGNGIASNGASDGFMLGVQSYGGENVDFYRYTGNPSNPTGIPVIDPASSGQSLNVIGSYVASTSTLSVQLNHGTVVTTTVAPTTAVYDAISIGYRYGSTFSPNFVLGELNIWQAAILSGERTAWLARNTAKWGGS